MFGKHFSSMYEGSMVGKGSAFFAVWGYIISHFVPDRQVGAQVDLNPKVLAFVIGEKEEVVVGVIEDMCRPDAASRSQTEEGRKLVKIGTYSYRVVNGRYYRAIRNEEDRREYQRLKQREYRLLKKGRASLAERNSVKNEGADGEAEGIPTIPENGTLVGTEQGINDEKKHPDDFHGLR